MLFHINSSSGIPVYLQIIEQVKHAVETGALRPGDQLPAIRKLAVDLAINPNTVVRAYRELVHEKIIELKQGSGAFISESVMGKTNGIQRGQKIVHSAMERLKSLGLSEEEITLLVKTNPARLLSLD